jgi:hypothetical protein
MRTASSRALAQLAALDPAADGGGARPVAFTSTPSAPSELLLADILATPRSVEPVYRLPVAAPASAPGSRGFARERRLAGVIGLAASLALAMIATVLWVSPSAGAQHGRAQSVMTSSAVHGSIPRALGASRAIATW